MAANDDFFISFGSNAKTFSAKLIRELAPAREEVESLQKLLQDLERRGVPSPTFPAPGGGGGGGRGGSAPDTAKFQSALDDAGDNLSDITKRMSNLLKAMGGMEAFVKKGTATENRQAGWVGRKERGLGSYQDPKTGQVITNSLASRTPGALRMGVGAPLDPKFMAQLTALANKGGLGGNLATPASVRISDVSRSQVDQGGADRIVKAINKVRDEVRKLATRPVTVGGGASTTTVAAPAKGKKQTTAAAKEDEDVEAQLRRRLAEVQVKAQGIAALVAKAGDVAGDAMTEALDEVSAAQAEIKAELAKVERERTGLSRGDQSRARREKAKLAPDLPDAEWDRRTKMRQSLDMALNPDQFRAGVGRGKGQMGRAELVAMAKQLTAMGFQTKATSRTSMGDLTEGVISGRQAMRAQYGADIPAELQTGRRIVSDKISKAVREILEKANITAAEAAEEFQASDNIRLARQVGYLPKDPTLALPDGADRGVGQSAVKATGNMVKGGEYDDSVFGYQAGQELIRKNAMARAARLAQDKQFDPFRIRTSEEITGQGPKAREAGQAFRAIREATRDLDDLGSEFDTLAKTISLAEAAIKGAQNRLKRAAGDGPKLGESERQLVKTDDARIARAQDVIESAYADIRSKKFDGPDPEQIDEYRNLFADRDYQKGRAQRAYSREEQDLYSIKAEEKRRGIDPDTGLPRNIFTGDAAGAAFINRRQAPGAARGTMIDNLRGQARFDPRKGFQFTDDQRDPAELRDLNKAFRRTQTRLRREREAEGNAALGLPGSGKALAAAMRKTENSATAFLGQVEKVFDVPKTLQDVIGRDAFGEDARKSDAERALRAQDAYKSIAEPKRDTTSDAILMGQRLQGYDKTKAQETKASADLKTATDKVTRLEAKHATQIQTRIESLDASSKAAYNSARADLEIARAERQSIGSSQQGPRQAMKETSALLAAERRASDAKRALDSDSSKGPEREALVQEYREATREMDQLSKKVRREAADRERNAKRARAAHEKEEAARKRIAEIIGEESADLRSARGEEARLKAARDELAKALRDQADNIRQMAIDKAFGKLDSAESKMNEVTRTSGGIADVAAQQKRIDSAKAGVQKLASLSDDQLFEKLRAEAVKAGAKKGGPANAPSAQERATATGPEADALREKIRAAEAARRDITKLRAEKKKADAAEKANIQSQIDALKGDARTRGELKQMRQQLLALAGGGAGAAGGGKPPTASGGAARGGGGDSSSSNALLRDILTALNGIHRTLQTGVKMTGGGGTTQRVDAQGNPITRTASSRLSATREELKQAGVRIDGSRTGNTDPRSEAKAAVAQQRRLERIKESDIERAHTAALQENSRRQRDANQESRRSATITAAVAHEKLQLAQAEKLLDDAARRELATLAKLNKEGADNVQIAAQQAKAVAAVNRALANSGVGYAADRKQLGMSLVNSTQAPGQAPITSGTYQQLNRSARGINGFRAVDEGLASGVTPGGIFGEQTAFTQAMFGNSGFWSRVMNSTGTFIVRNFTAGFVFGLTAALQDVIYQGIITESTFIRVSDALEQTGRTAGGLRSELQSISSSYGVALNDVYMTAAGLVGVFEDVADIGAATRVVAELQAISMGALNAQEAMGVLASITGAYKNELRGGADGLQQVADTLTVVQNTIGANVETTSEGVGALSGLAQQLKIPFADMAVYVAQIAKLTNQTGAAAGEQFSRILASMQSGRGRAALSEALPGSGIEELLGGGEYGQALQLLMKKWDTLSESQQRNLSVTVAGQRQARSFAALMADTGKTLEATARAQNANGEAQKRATAIARTLNGLLQRLQTNFQNLAQNLVRTGILNFFGLLLGVLNATLGVVNSFLSRMNDIADSNAFLSMVKSWSAGLLGFLLTLKLVRGAYAGFQATIAATRLSGGALGAGLNAATGRDSNGEKVARASMTAAASGYFSNKSTDYRDRAKEADGAHASRLGAQAKAASAASRASAGLSNTMTALGRAGMGANFALAALVVGVTVFMDEINRRSQMKKDFKELAKTYSAETGEITDPSAYDPGGEKYVGPATEAMKKNEEATDGKWDKAQYEFVEFVKPRWMAVSENEWKGILDEKLQGQIDALDRASRDALDGIDKGLTDGDLMYQGSDLTVGNPLNYLDTTKGYGQGEMAKKYLRKAEKGITVEGATNAGEKINADIERQRQEILTQVDEEIISVAQGNTALAALEKLAIESNERVANMILRARGIAEADTLSMEQIKQIDQIRPLLQQIQGSGVSLGNKDFRAGLDALITDTGVPQDSKVGGMLRQLAQGNMTRVEAMTKERKIVEEEYQNAQAKYIAATTGETALDPEQVDEIEQELINKMGELAAYTETMISAFIEESTTLADAAAAAGDYSGAARALEDGLNNVAGLRDRKSETPEVRARRDLVESNTAQRAGEMRAQEQNTRLQMAQARSMSSDTDARLEAQIARNTYQSLMSTQRAAQAAGRQGPPAEALRAAKIAWINAENQLAQIAQSANIAAMTAAAAGLWNGIAQGQAQEGIALQQYKDAVSNFGANSTEALNALAGYKNAQKSTISTLDQVAQATRDASAAAIPQGDGVRVARFAVANAKAALRAAAKYGRNSVEYQGALAQLYSAQQQASAATAAVAQAQAQLAQAYAEARGDGVAAARAGVAMARAAYAAALQASGGARSAEVISAQAQIVAANAAVSQAQEELITSRIQVSIALADAAGNDVRSAVLGLRAARVSLAFARRRSNGELTAEVAQAKAGAIAARAAVRDARLQDDLDTIDFNVQMGKMTQSSAISALREILKTRKLTEDQRRSLMLQIKGMQEELSGSPWNFGEIDLPKPYLMKRYIAEQKAVNTQRMDAVVGQALSASQTAAQGARAAVGQQYNDNRNVEININGGDEGRVRRIIREEVGRPGRTRTTQSRRGRR